MDVFMDIVQTLINSSIFGTIIGVILGFVLSEWATKQRTKRERDERNKSSREIISLEIAINIKTLKKLWDEITKETKKQISKRDLAKKFIEQPFENFSKKAFESQLLNMADALSSLEVEQVFRFYERLEKIKDIQEKLNQLMKNQTDEESDAVIKDKNTGLSRAFRPHPRPFDDKSPILWNQCESLVSQVFAKGNPIRKQ